MSDAQTGPAIRQQVSMLAELATRDLINSSHHSRDFGGTRADNISTRVRVLALLFAVATPLWAVIDVLTLPASAAMPLVILRLIAGGIFAGIAFYERPRHMFKRTYASLLAMMITGSLFYVISRTILDGQIGDGVLAGYTYLPLVLVALAAIFPLTLIEGIVVSAIIVVAVVVVEYILGSIASVTALGYLWLMGLLIGIAVTAELSQLLMLLRLHRQATRDYLTTLFNRRALIERFEEEVARARRYDRKLSVLLFDLDRFKRVNDEYGHLTGDSVLRDFATVLVGEHRTTDVVGRYGGEEFLTVLPDTDLEGARVVAERVRVACMARAISVKGQNDLTYTVSVGVAELKDEDDPDTLFKRVDGRLYQAKEEGRNRVIVAN